MASQKDGWKGIRDVKRPAEREPTFISGKPVIITIAFLAMLGAVSSWWFRYNATHRSAQFLGPHVSQIIRDAPLVEALKLEPADPPGEGDPLRESVRIGDRDWHIMARSDISHARGLTHLREAFLEDQSYDWDDRSPRVASAWPRGLGFRGDEKSPPALLLFTPDFRNVFISYEREGRSDNSRNVSTAPIAAGLGKMFGEFDAKVKAE